MTDDRSCPGLDNRIDVLLLQDPPIDGRRVCGFENDRYRTIVYDGEEAKAVKVFSNPDFRVMADAQHTSKYMATMRLFWVERRNEYLTMTTLYCSTAY